MQAASLRSDCYVIKHQTPAYLLRLLLAVSGYGERQFRCKDRNSRGSRRGIEGRPAATERTKTQCLLANVERRGGCDEVWPRERPAPWSPDVSAEPLNMVPQRVPSRAESEWNAKLLRRRTHDADRMARSESLKIRMHPGQSAFAYQEINLANRAETAQQVQISRYAVHIRADCANLGPCTGPATTA